MYRTLLEELQSLVYGENLSPIEERVVTVLRDAVKAMAKGPMLPKSLSPSQVPKASAYTEPRVFRGTNESKIIAAYKHPYLPSGGAPRIGKAKWEELTQEVIEWTGNMLNAGFNRFDEVIPYIIEVACTFGTNSWVDVTIRLDNTKTPAKGTAP